MKVLIFDKFLGYNVGGAQRTLHALLAALPTNVFNLHFIGCDVRRAFNATSQRFVAGSIDRFDIVEWPRLPYLEYLMNRSRIKKIFQSRTEKVLVTQGLWGAAAVRFFSGKAIYFIRDEYQLNRIPLYQSGIKKILKLLYLFIQLPGFLMLWSDNRRAIAKASVVIANSVYIQKEIKKIFKRDSEVVYPLVEAEKFVHNPIPPFNLRPYITCIGSEYMKGRPIVEQLAKAMPDYQFMIVGREFKKTVQQKNLIFQPWVNDPVEVFQKTKILLMPSICAEAFGRAALEAQLLGIPVLGSNRGGISEVVAKENLVDDIWNINLWHEKICKINADILYPQEKVVLFSSEAQQAKFQKLLQLSSL